MFLMNFQCKFFSDIYGKYSSSRLIPLMLYLKEEAMLNPLQDPSEFQYFYPHIFQNLN